MILRMLRRYGAFVQIAFKDEVRHWHILLGRLAFFAILMAIFSRLWSAALESGMRVQVTPSDLLWYLAATEWIVLSCPSIQFRIEDDVRDGSYVYFLGRPISYVNMRLAEALGQLILRAGGLGSVGFLITYIAAGTGPAIGPYLPFYLVIGFFATATLLLYHAAIGMCALWMHESTPLFWLWQKCLFILGGLMIPLFIYPEWLQSAAAWLPFYGLLYAPASLMIQFDTGSALHALLLIGIWAVVGVALLAAITQAAQKHIVMGGG